MSAFTSQHDYEVFPECYSVTFGGECAGQLRSPGETIAIAGRPRAAGHVAYICGRPGFVIDTMKALMKARLFPHDIYREDFFDSADRVTGTHVVRSPLIRR